MSSSLHRPCQQPKERGLSLLEVVVAIAVTAIVAVALAAAIVTALRMNTMSRNRVTARNAATALLDEIMQIESTSTITTLYHNQRFTAGTGTLSLTRVDDLDPILVTVGTSSMTTANIIEVRVRVEWDDANGLNAFELGTMTTDRRPSE